MEVLEERRRVRERVVEEARRWAAALPFRSSAVLIGSYARGDFNKWSDVDVLLVAEFEGDPLRRLRSIDAPPGYQVIPLTPRELERLLERGDPLAREAASVGVVLRDDLGIAERLARYRERGSPGASEAGRP